MAQQGHRPVVTFTMGFKEADDELSYARSVASLYHTDHHEFTFAPHDLAEILPRIVWHMDEPMSDSGALATYWVSQFVRNHVKVILVGEGADEVFAGYRWHRFGSPRLRLIPECFRLRLAVYLATFFATRSRRARLDAYTPHDPHDRIMTYWRNAVGSDFLDRYLDYEIRFQLPNHLLMKVDRMTMAHSVEARVPYLDHRLVEFAASLPPEEKLSGWTGKMILRRAVAHRLPRDIIRRPKHGFIVPLGQWLQTSLREFAREHLLDRGSFTRLVFSEAAIEELFRPALNPLVSTERESLLWRLLVLEIWLELFVKGKQDEI
jgi:asparagine synthase (glutamine-hydrolysing)